MRAVVQRVRSATVTITSADNAPRVVGEIRFGLLVYVAVVSDDGPGDVTYIADKVAHLRVFSDSAGS